MTVDWRIQLTWSWRNHGSFRWAGYLNINSPINSPIMLRWNSLTQGTNLQIGYFFGQNRASHFFVGWFWGIQTCTMDPWHNFQSHFQLRVPMTHAVGVQPLSVSWTCRTRFVVGCAPLSAQMDFQRRGTNGRLSRNLHHRISWCKSNQNPTRMPRYWRTKPPVAMDRWSALPPAQNRAPGGQRSRDRWSVWNVRYSKKFSKLRSFSKLR